MPKFKVGDRVCYPANVNLAPAYVESYGRGPFTVSEVNIEDRRVNFEGQPQYCHQETLLEHYFLHLVKEAIKHAENEKP